MAYTSTILCFECRLRNRAVNPQRRRNTRIHHRVEFRDQTPQSQRCKETVSMDLLAISIIMVFFVELPILMGLSFAALGFVYGRRGSHPAPSYSGAQRQGTRPRL